MEGSERFDVIAKTARVDADLNSRDARLSRLADDPILLKLALSENGDQAFGPILNPSTADAVAMVSSRNLLAGSHQSRVGRPYAEAGRNTGTTTSLHPEPYDGAADPPGSRPAAPQEAMQFAILAGSTFCFLTLAALVLFAG